MIFRIMTEADIDGVVALQALCFPPPFPSEELWKDHQLKHHLKIFPEGQFVCEVDGNIVASASNSRISEQNWQAHLPWHQTLGGFTFETFDPHGTTMYGADISVHPAHRKKGIARNLYQCRFDAVKKLSLSRYGTACRIPDYLSAIMTEPSLSVEDYGLQVSQGIKNDRTLSPLLKMGLKFCGIINNYMEDQESGNAAALLEWTPE